MPLVWNWHLDAICMHLEAITFGTFLKMGLRNRLLINVPPGSSKSLIVSVFWQAWEWSIGFTSHRFLCTSYDDAPVSRDSQKCRDLIMSDWYKRHWPEVELVNKGETQFSNKARGTRAGAAFGSLTGKRGDRFILDDPHSTEGSESDANRTKTTKRFREGALNRLNNQKLSAIVVIMQRLHGADISGVILAHLKGYIHLCIPMEFEPFDPDAPPEQQRPNKTPIWQDPRSRDGELMDPVRWPPEEIELLKVEMGAYAWAGQYQQAPTPREGGLFKRHWFADKFKRVAPAGTRWVRHWDLASTDEKQATANTARTAGVKLGRCPDGSYLVGHSIATREEGAAVRMLIKSTAETERTTEISLPQDPGQAGKVQAKELVSYLAGFVVRATPETGTKEQRAEPFSVQCEAGNVYLLQTGDVDKDRWIEPFLEELCLFPGGVLKDQVDAVSGAFARLVMAKGPVIVGPIVVTAQTQHLGDHPGVTGGGGS